MRIKSKIILLSSLIYIPMNHQGWRQLEYRSIVPNTISTIKENGDHLKIYVSESASPLIYKFDKPKKIKSISIKATLISGDLKLHGITQGESGADDFILRVGLVAKGNQQLNFLQKLVAPIWVKELHKLGKDSSGIEKIYFYNVSSSDLSWKERVHPRSKLISEKIVKKIDGNKIQFSVATDLEKEYLGIWISSDGDDTKSKFEISIDEIQLEEL